MYTVYMLLCRDGSLYTGITNDLPRRLQMHMRGVASRYTRSRGVERVVYTERKRTRGAALKREYAMKQMKREQKLTLINTYL